LWFPDLSQPDPYYILPFVIGGVFFVQQKIMPMQMDPAQQKMMMYFMPGMFTVFMLFLPSGLGVYMFTNSLLGIVQQQVVQHYVKRSDGTGGDTPNQKTIETTGEAVGPKTSGKGKRRRKGKSRQDKNEANLSRTPSLTERKA
jgi:YidC/Oxa1 family membrane protein insertase